MRTLGTLAVIAGIISLLVSCSMDVSVATDSGTRVNNIGLMHQQNMLLMTGFGLLLIGFLMRFAGRSKSEPRSIPLPVQGALSAEEIIDLDVLLAGKGRTGISLSADDPRVVGAVYDGSPADLAGVRPGDRLIQIDGRFVEGNLRENVMQLCGDVGQLRGLSTRRGETAISVELTLVAGNYPVVSGGGDASQFGSHSVGTGPDKSESKGFSAWPYILVLSVLFLILFFRLGR